MDRETADAIIESIEQAVATHAPGGMVGAFIFACEMYGEGGEPYLFTARSQDHTAWTHLGMIDALRVDTETPLRRSYEDDE